MINPGSDVTVRDSEETTVKEGIIRIDGPPSFPPNHRDRTCESWNTTKAEAKETKEMVD
jgi:hypothetical protein